jgi:urea transport system permease protein
MRAVTQNRRMAAAMGIRTAQVDALTFALGSGIAGIAGVALSQIDNVSPNLGTDLHHRQLHGRGVRRRRQSLGHAGRRLTLGIRQQAARAGMLARCWARSWCWWLIILFIQKRPRGLFALKGRAVERQ